MEGGSHDRKRVISKLNREGSGPEHDLAGIGLLDFNPAIRCPTALGQLEKDTNFLIQQWEGRLFQRPNRAEQTDKRDSAWILRIDLDIFADDQIPNGRMHLAHRVPSESAADLGRRALFMPV
jgi:hypothetical protein